MSESTNKKFLLISSDEQNISAKLSYLNNRKITCLAANTIIKGINILKSGTQSNCVDLVICDFDSIETDDAESLKFLQYNPLGVPVVLMVSAADVDKVGPLIKKNIKDYLLKPFKREALSRILESLISPPKDFDY